MQDRTKRLLGQDIDIVKGGLKEEQVVAFVNELIDIHTALIERQDHFLSLGALSEKTSSEAGKLAAEIKARAAEEAGTEKAATISRANQTARDILANARKRAQEITRTESDSIIEAAHRKAQAIEIEAKQRSQLFLIKARSLIENDIKGQFVDIYEQLLSSLHDLIAENNEIESRWNNRIVELWRRETLELGEYETGTSFLVSGIARADKTGDSVTGMDRTEISANEPVAEAKEEDILFEARAKKNAIPDLSSLKAEVFGFTQEKPAEHRPDREAITVDYHEEKTEDTSEISKPAEDKLSRVAAFTDHREEESRDTFEAAKTGEDKPAREDIPAEYHEEKTGDTPVLAEPGSNPRPPVYGGNFDGEVDINLVPPIDLSAMARIIALLQGRHEVKILRTAGSYDKGNTITVFVEKPLPLISILSELPEIEVYQDTSRKRGVFSLSAGGDSSQSKKFTIIVKTQTDSRDGDRKE